MVKSKQLYSPQNYLSSVTGKCFVYNSDNDIEFIENILKDENLWSYPLDEIDHIVENNLNVVLVECMVFNEEKQEFEKVYRWFEVPEDWTEEDAS